MAEQRSWAPGGSDASAGSGRALAAPLSPPGVWQGMASAEGLASAERPFACSLRDVLRCTCSRAAAMPLLSSTVSPADAPCAGTVVAPACSSAPLPFAGLSAASHAAAGSHAGPRCWHTCKDGGCRPEGKSSRSDAKPRTLQVRRDGNGDYTAIFPTPLNGPPVGATAAHPIVEHLSDTPTRPHTSQGCPWRDNRSVSGSTRSSTSLSERCNAHAARDMQPMSTPTRPHSLHMAPDARSWEPGTAPSQHPSHKESVSANRQREGRWPRPAPTPSPTPSAATDSAPGGARGCASCGKPVIKPVSAPSTPSICTTAGRRPPPATRDGAVVMGLPIEPAPSERKHSSSDLSRQRSAGSPRASPGSLRNSRVNPKEHDTARAVADGLKLQEEGAQGM